MPLRFVARRENAAHGREGRDATSRRQHPALRGGPLVNISIVDGGELDTQELLSLYDALGWASYTRDPDVLARAVANSSVVAVARDLDGTLVGLARALSDDASVFYLQDILVRPDHQRSGVGRQLFDACLDRYAHVRQKVLLTDDDEAQRGFYESLGFVRTVDFEGAPLNAYVRFDT